MNNDLTYFSFYANCILIKGKSKCAIYDIQLGRFYPFENIVYDVFSISKKRTIKSLKAKFDGVYNSGIDEYIKYFLNQNLGFITEYPHEYPALNLFWEKPFSIINCILEREWISSYNLKDVWSYPLS